jgi:hypothetical protein
MRYLFIHSPLLGPGSWGRVAERIGGLVPDLRSFVSADPPRWRAFVDLAVEGAPDGPCVAVVGHSGAGALLPAVVDRLAPDRPAIVFVDAVLPPAEGSFAVTPAMRLFLEARSEQGVLDPWSAWWDDEVLARTLQVPALRAAIESEEPRVPLSFYDEAIPVPTSWSERPCGYVRLSAAYDSELSHAQVLGWPTAGVDGSHLEMLTHPEAVVAAIRTVMDQLG